MAQTKNKQSTAGKKGTRAANSKSGRVQSGKRQNTRKKKQAATQLQLEIRNWLIFFVLVLVTLGIYLKDNMGMIGTSLSDVFVGLFGFSAYLISVYSTLIAGMKLFGKLERRTLGKLIAGYLAIVLVAALFHIMNAAKLTSIGAMYQKATVLTGGVIGGMIGRLFTSLLGKVGSIILVIFILVILGIIVTERSFVKGVKHAAGKTKEKGQQVRSYTSERAAEYAKWREERRLQTELREEEKKAWSSDSEEGPRLDMEEPSQAGGDRQIVIRGLKSDVDEDEKLQNEIKKNAVDIPLISHDLLLSNQ